MTRGGRGMTRLETLMVGHHPVPPPVCLRCGSGYLRALGGAGEPPGLGCLLCGATYFGPAASKAEARPDLTPKPMSCPECQSRRRHRRGCSRPPWRREVEWSGLGRSQ